MSPWLPVEARASHERTPLSNPPDGTVSRCGYAVLSVQARLRETLDVIRRELPPAKAESLIDELAPIWTRP